MSTGQYVEQTCNQASVLTKNSCSWNWARQIIKSSQTRFIIFGTINTQYKDNYNTL